MILHRILKKVDEYIKGKSNFYPLVESDSRFPGMAEFHGNKEYGGWLVCNRNISKDSIVYSFGVGEDVSFDLSLIRKYHLQVFAFEEDLGI